MAQAGLFANPLTPATGGASSLNPLVSAPPPVATGLDALQQSLADITAIGETARQRVPIVAPQVAPQSAPSIAFSPSTKQFFVQGRTFSQDDAQSALESEALLGQPGVAAPQGGDWVPVDPQSYAGYLQGIKNPGLGTLFAKGFGRGIDTMELLAGRGLQLAGAEKFGGDIVKQQVEDLRRTEPYSRRFSDIQGGGDAVEWFVANLGEQSPMLLEGVLTGGLGAIAGSTVARVGANVALRQALKKRAEGIALDAAEQKLVRYAAGGAIAASLGSNYATGAADIYGEFRDQGADANDAQARVLSLLGAVPYALFESAPEVALGARVLKGFGAPKALAAGASLKRRGAELLRRGAVGGAIGGVAEGTTEAGQEALLLGLTGQDFSKPENVTRLIDSFAAGAALGGPIGAVFNLRSKEPANILNPGQGAEEQLTLPLEGGGGLRQPETPFPGTTYGREIQGELFPTGEDSGLGPRQETFEGFPNVERGALRPRLDTRPFLTRAEEEEARRQAELDIRNQPTNLFDLMDQLELPLRAPRPFSPLDRLDIPTVEGEDAQATAALNALRAEQAAALNALRAEQGLQALNRGDIPVVSPESGLAPFRYGDLLTRPSGTLADNPVLRAVQQRQQEMLAAQQEAQLAAQRQAAFQQAQGAVPPIPEVGALGQRLAESQPFLDVMGTEGRLIAEPQYGVTDEEAAESWRSLQGPGRPKLFTKFLPGIRSQWVNALNMAQAGELSRADLKDIRTRLIAAENAARLTKSDPATVVTGAITPTPPPTPPKGGKLRAKKPEAAKVSTAKQPATRTKALKERGRKRATGKPVTEPKKSAESAAKPVQKEQGKAVQDVKSAPKAAALKKGKGEQKFTKAEAAPAYASAEEAWEDMKPVGALPFKKLDKQLQDKWQTTVDADKASMDEASLIYGQVEVSPKQAVAEAIAAVDEATDEGDTFWDAVNTLVEYAFFTTDETNTKKVIASAQAKLDRKNFTDAQWRSIKAAFVQQANDANKLSAVVSKGENKGALRPWFEFAADNDLFIKIRVPVTNTESIDPVLQDMVEAAGPAKQQPAVTKQATYETKPVAADTALSKLAAILTSKLKVFSLNNKYTFSQTSMSKEEYPNLPFALKKFYADVNEVDRGVMINGYPLRDYFTEDGEAKFEQDADGMNTPTAKSAQEVTAAQIEQAAVHDALTPEDEQTLADHYGQDSYNDVAKSRFVDDVVTAINKGLQAVSEKIREIVKKVQAGVLAVAVVFNPASLQIPELSFRQAAQTVEVRATVPADAAERMSPLARMVYESAAPIAKRNGKGFMIADKPNGVIHVFGAKGEYITSGAALFGKQSGDVLVSTATAEDMVDADKVTPAGTFKLRLAPNKDYTGGYFFALMGSNGRTIGRDANGRGGSVAIHSVYTYAVAENRINRLKSATAADNKISFGCINTSEKMFLDDLLPRKEEFNGGMVFVMPDNVTMTESMFRPETREQRAPAPLSPTRDNNSYDAIVARIKATEQDSTGRYSLSRFNQPDRADPAVGKLRMAITRFVSKLATKPKVSVFKNQADMKAKNPALYRKAVAARPEGDFDTALAAGFSFGDGNVVIFTDRIANEQHLNFVLAHETLGHFGLRGIIPANQFNAAMEAIYKASPAIRSDVDIAVANGQSKAEAVEEYLSDFAAVLDTSVVARVWNAIKGALNKLGIKFGDEMVRYILKHSRAYVRSGKSSMFDTAKVFIDLQDVENGNGYASTGRFSTVGDIHADMRTAELVRDNIGGMPSDWESAWSDFKGFVGNNTDSFDRFKAEYLSLANFRARENPGLHRLEEILEGGRNLTSSIRVSSNERNAEIFNAAILGKYFGVTTKQTDSVNKLMYAAQRLAVSKIKDIRSLKGAPLYEVMEDGSLKPNQPEIDKLTKQGMVEFEDARGGFKYEVQLPDGTTRIEEFEGIPGLTKESIEWRGYVSLRETVNDVELHLLRARYQSLYEDRQIAFKQFDELVVDKRLTDAEKALLRRLIKTYNDLYTTDISFGEDGYPKHDPDAMTRGNDFAIAVNKALMLAKDDDFKRLADFFEGKVADDVVAQMREFSKRLRLEGANKYTIQNRVKQIGLLEVSNTDADLYVRRTLATGYTPLLREGQFQIRVEAVSPTTGKVVRLADAYREQLIYSQVEKQSEAEELAAGINDVFKGKTYEVDAYSSDSGEFVRQTVVFRAVSETALDAIAGPPELNLNEFVYGLRQLDIALTPKEMERVVTALTKQNSAARNRLMRAFTPGADPDAIKAVSRHIETRASTIAKTIMRPQLSELMNLSMESTQRLWKGDPKLLGDLKAMAEDTNRSQGERNAAQKEYDRYRYMYEQTNPKGGKPKRANQFYNEASRTVEFLNGNHSVTESNFESGAIASRIRTATGIMQLGGSIATGAVGLISPYTNGIPFLASYNSKNGFGGGFGMGPAVVQFHIATKQVGVLGMTNLRANTAKFYDEVAASKDLQTRYGLKKHEAEFIAREIREGAMIPAQTNALINTSRGQISSGFQRKFIDGWMLPFNLTEQASRRAFGLAAYRLEYKRQIEGGKSEAKAQETARRFAVEAINLTLGEYSVLNRPPAWRSGIRSFLYMYKVFPTTSIQLFNNLSWGGKIAMLASLWALSGLQGLPFAEDLEDLIDTLAQALGFKSGSIRLEIAKFIDGVFPGMSPYFLQGLVNSVVPADIAGRVSIGNVLPGTGILLSGADVGRELTDIAGPAPSALLGSASFAANLLRAPFSDRIELADVVREAPITMLRAVGDTVAYSKSDATVDRRGYVVNVEANAGVIAARLLGFYPAAAAEQYGAIRIAKRVSDYQRDVVAGFRQSWIEAKMEGDDARARDIVSAVNDWNAGAEGTGLKIDNFLKNSQRALKEAQRPAGERMLRTTPKAGREDIEKAFELLTY